MTKAHPITVEVVRNAVVAYADEMANVLAVARGEGKNNPA